MDLNIIWFVLFTVLIIGYAILDGFDLGVGVLHLFTKDENEKRININSIGPVWDGNEVWLLTGGGALFAAFPKVYATVFSGFYLAFMLLLFALIFRAVSMEFRGKVDSPSWKKVWDFSFSIGSLLPAVLFGVAFGNILHGIPIDENGYYTGTFFTLLNPYSVLIGVLSLVLFTMHGALYLGLKTGGSQKERSMKIASFTWVFFIVLYLAATLFTFLELPHLFEGVFSNPVSLVLLLLFVVTVLYIPFAIRSNRTGQAFIMSSLTILSLIGLSAVSIFPRLVPSVINDNYSLTIYNASSTERTLFTMFIIALIGMPIVIFYTIFIYRAFKGRVVLDEHSY